MVNRRLGAGAPGITMRQALERTAEQLEASALRLDALQDSVGSLGSRALTSATSEALQGLDGTTQIVRELGLVLHRLAGLEGEGGCVAAAFSGVRLSALRANLMGERADEAPLRHVELW